MCSSAPGARSRTTSATAASGWIVPTSLLTSSTDTRATSLVERVGQRARGRRRPGRRRAPCARRPAPPGGARRGARPRVHTTVPGRAPSTPRTARSSASVPPLVNTTSPGRHPTTAASRARAASSSARACAGQRVGARRVAEALGQQRARARRRPRAGSGCPPHGRGSASPRDPVSHPSPARHAGGAHGRLRGEHLRRPLRRRVRRLVRRRHRRSRLHRPGGGPVADGRRRPGPRARHRVGPPRPPAGRAGPRGPRDRRVSRRWSSGCGPSPAARRSGSRSATWPTSTSSTRRPFAVVLVAFNTFFNLATEADQRRCLRRVADAARARGLVRPRGVRARRRRGQRHRRRAHPPPHLRRRGRPVRQPAGPCDADDQPSCSIATAIWSAAQRPNASGSSPCCGAR